MVIFLVVLKVDLKLLEKVVFRTLIEDFSYVQFIYSS